MHTLILHISDTVYEKLLWLLRKFDKTEVEIIHEDLMYNSNKAYLTKELDALIVHESEFISTEELQHSINSTILKYED
jgi:hypothetical protein